MARYIRRTHALVTHDRNESRLSHRFEPRIDVRHHWDSLAVLHQAIRADWSRNMDIMDAYSINSPTATCHDLQGMEETQYGHVPHRGTSNLRC